VQRWVRRILGWAAVAMMVGGDLSSSAAGGFVIESLDIDAGLVFRTPTNASAHHHYRVEHSPSLSSPEWRMVQAATGIAPGSAVSNRVEAASDHAFYRVVSTSNSAVFVDGAYLVIDVSAGPEADGYPVTPFDNAHAVPGGVTNDLYKTTSILMRRIPSGTFTMGSPTEELGRHDDREAQRQVTLTKDFYIGVFEITQRQWEQVMGDDWPSWFENEAYRDTRPLEYRSWNHIRGGVWPGEPAGSGQPAAGTFIERIRTRTGLSFDLPTEAQWEYACRAGTSTALNSGKNLTTADLDNACPNVDEVGRYRHNHPGGYSSNRSRSTASGTAKVGSYLPNAWGLYDMIGNVGEWCLDWHMLSPQETVDPVGPDSGAGRVRRGGSWPSYTYVCRSAFRYTLSPSSTSNGDGFRLSWTLP